VFVSDNVVTPITRTSSKIVGARRTLQVLTADLFPRRDAPPTAHTVITPRHKKTSASFEAEVCQRACHIIGKADWTG
jgi:hypothetical protein